MLSSDMNPACFMKQIPPWTIVIVGLVLVTVVGIVDGITGSEYSLPAFYLIPVVLTAWYAGRHAVMSGTPDSRLPSRLRRDVTPG